MGQSAFDMRRLTYVSYYECSEEGVMHFQSAIVALKEFRANGTLNNRVVKVEHGSYRYWKWTAMIHEGETLLFVVECGGSMDFAWAFSEEAAENLQQALGRYQYALEALRSTGKAPGWL